MNVFLQSTYYIIFTAGDLKSWTHPELRNRWKRWRCLTRFWHVQVRPSWQPSAPTCVTRHWLACKHEMAVGTFGHIFLVLFCLHIFLFVLQRLSPNLKQQKALYWMTKCLAVVTGSALNRQLELFHRCCQMNWLSDVFSTTICWSFARLCNESLERSLCKAVGLIFDNTGINIVRLANVKCWWKKVKRNTEHQRAK